MITCPLTCSLFLDKYAVLIGNEKSSAINIETKRRLDLNRCTGCKDAHERLLLICLHDYVKSCPNPCAIRRLTQEGDVVVEANQLAIDLFGGEIAGVSLRRLAVDKKKYRQACKKVLDGIEAAWVGNWMDLDGEEMELVMSDRLAKVGDVPVSVVEWQKVS